ncbi:MAG: hypothetical protein NTU88_01335 [Armatimonadetes bacterium]|nr:hypothetical protein [Armatimonadota bacterium]
MDVVRFADTGSGVRRGKYLHVAVRGEPIPLEVEVEEEENIVYAAKLSRPIEPGECQDLLVVYRDGVPNARLVNEKERVWLFRPGLMVKDPGEVDVRVEAVRLPPNARLLSCDPRPDEVFANDTITVLWRRVLADWETFGLTVVYQSGQA